MLPLKGIYLLAAPEPSAAGRGGSAQLRCMGLEGSVGLGGRRLRALQLHCPDDDYQVRRMAGRPRTAHRGRGTMDGGGNDEMQHATHQMLLWIGNSERKQSWSELLFIV